MQLSSLTTQVSTQAAAQASALASLLLLRKTLELQASGIGSLVQAATPASIAEVNRLISDPAQTAPRTLTFRGVVTFVSRAGDVCHIQKRQRPGAWPGLCRDGVQISARRWRGA